MDRKPSWEYGINGYATIWSSIIDGTLSIFLRLCLLAVQSWVVLVCCLFFKDLFTLFLLFRVNGKSNYNGDFSHAEVVKGAKNRAGLRRDFPKLELERNS